ncbi:hypothetical protein PF010_g25182 [Phytophthora fragariae]|uniref:Uncharacterized protein n=1 Tax=Phytophthora fragariae TaxID=53985 RepID=A0A6G0K0X5_9STRA|nr:hypothetical protein PF010_g25182 [Phytophthora fragariae]
MDLPLTVVESLHRVFESQDAIRHQRHANRETYLRMTEIYAELQLSESVQTNATLQRTGTVEKFGHAVSKFATYLQRYNGMSRATRLFKRSENEEQRQAIADEIDRVVEMLNLAATMNAMTSGVSAVTNDARLFDRLEDIQADLMFIHDEMLVQQQLNQLAVIRITTRDLFSKIIPVKLSVFKVCLLAEEPENG